jgi:hypothetical protein
MFDRLLSCVMAVSLALLIWLYTRSREHEMLENVTIPVEVALAPRQADSYALEVKEPSQITLSFAGSMQRIRELHLMLQRKEIRVLKTITVNEDKSNDGKQVQTLVIEPADINTPLGITPILAEARSRIHVTIYRIIERRLPVRFDSIRELDGLSVILEPNTVLVRGPRDVLERAQYIKTEPSELPSRPLNGLPTLASVGRVALVDTLDGRPVRVTPPTVRVRVPGQPRKTYELSDVPVHFLCPSDFRLRPKFIDERASKITLKLQGPIQDEPPRVYAFIDLTRGRFVSGLNHEPLQLQLPRDFQIVKESAPPSVVAFELLPGDFFPEGAVVPAVPSGRD